MIYQIVPKPQLLLLLQQRQLPQLQQLQRLFDHLHKNLKFLVIHFLIGVEISQPFLSQLTKAMFKKINYYNESSNEFYLELHVSVTMKIFKSRAEPSSTNFQCGKLNTCTSCMGKTGINCDSKLPGTARYHKSFLNFISVRLKTRGHFFWGYLILRKKSPSQKNRIVRPNNSRF